MAKNRTRRQSRSRPFNLILKPRGAFHPRVQAVGPQHFGIVAIERTGRYHHLIQRAFAAAGFEVRIVHPFATKQFRQPANPGHKTDDTDLAAILHDERVGFRAGTLHKLLAWARTAALLDTAASTHHRLTLALDDDRRQSEYRI